MKIKDGVPLYLKHLKALGRSEHTLIGTKSRLKKFLLFLEAEQIHLLEDLTYDVLLDYQQDLAFCLTSTGKLLALESQAKLLSSVKGFTRFLKEREYLLHDPGEKISLPKKAKRLPKVILSVDEMKKLLHAPDMRTNTGYRNRVILEVLYDTAIRRSELSQIKLSDMD
ncbi:MAG: site-specific integrase, partial [Thermodesulfobacteriota bacterium]|nr:site-specific integrase [Thermodesulfobacteriota bacterium]